MSNSENKKLTREEAGDLLSDFVLMQKGDLLSLDSLTGFLKQKGYSVKEEDLDFSLPALILQRFPRAGGVLGWVFDLRFPKKTEKFSDETLLAGTPELGYTLGPIKATRANSEGVIHHGLTRQKRMKTK